MEIRDVPARIKELEETIFKAIKEFEKETTLEVTFISTRDKFLTDFTRILDGITVTVMFKKESK